jgi:hypothetical protein
MNADLFRQQMLDLGLDEVQINGLISLAESRSEPNSVLFFLQKCFKQVGVENVFV